MKKVRYYCDRCGASLSTNVIPNIESISPYGFDMQKYPIIGASLSIINYSGEEPVTRQIDICDNCKTEILNFISQGGKNK